MMETREEARRQQEAVKDTPQELEFRGSVRARIKKPVDTIYSLRFTGDEMKFLQAAAKARGIKLSELIREAAMDAAARAQNQPSRREEALREARELVGAAARALDRIKP